MRRWQRFLPHSYWLMASAAILLIVIGVRLVVLWRNGVIGDWAIFLFGLVAVIALAVFIMMLVTFRHNQLEP